MDALHDELTGLPSRALLFDRLTQALARARRAGTWVGVIHLDLDASAGPDEAGGAALPPTALSAIVTEIAARLVSSLRDTDTCARVEERTFVVVCEDLGHPGDGELVERRLTAAAVRGVQFDGVRVRTGVRSGVAVGSIGAAPTELLETASRLARQGDANPGADLDIAVPGM